MMAKLLLLPWIGPIQLQTDEGTYSNRDGRVGTDATKAFL